LQSRNSVPVRAAGTGRSAALEVGEPNPLRDEHSILWHIAIAADFCAHSSIGKFAVDEAVFVDAKFFNGFLDFFRSRLHHWAWEPAPCARLPRDEDGA